MRCFPTHYEGRDEILYMKDIYVFQIRNRIERMN